MYVCMCVYIHYIYNIPPEICPVKDSIMVPLEVFELSEGNPVGLAQQQCRSSAQHSTPCSESLGHDCVHTKCRQRVMELCETIEENQQEIGLPGQRIGFGVFHGLHEPTQTLRFIVFCSIRGRFCMCLWHQHWSCVLLRFGAFSGNTHLSLYMYIFFVCIYTYMCTYD